MTTDRDREAFEAWCKDKRIPTDKYVALKCYTSSRAGTAWEAWQAALAHAREAGAQEPAGYGMRELEDVRVACLARVDAAAQRAEFTPEQRAFALRLVAEISGGIEGLSLPVGHRPNGPPHPAPAQEPAAVPAARDDFMRRVAVFFDGDPTAGPFMAEDGDGGFLGAIDRMAREIERLRSIAAEPVSPAADEQWDAGCDFAMQQLCVVLGVEQENVQWEAATETIDGDVQAVLRNILEAAFGEDWQVTQPTHVSPPAESGEVERLREALKLVRGIIVDAAMTGFNCHDGDWAQRLFESQGPTSRAIRSRTPAPQPGGAVKVKALEWENYPPNPNEVVYGVDGRRIRDRAVTPWGAYFASRGNDDEGGGYFARSSKGDFETRGDSLAEVEAAAQADYERRILSALEPFPSGWNAGAFEAGAKAMRKAIVEDWGYLTVEEIMALPLPTPPAGEG